MLRFIQENIINILIVILLLVLTISVCMASASKIKRPKTDYYSEFTGKSKRRLADNYFYQRRDIWLQSALGLTYMNVTLQTLSLFCSFWVVYIAVDSSMSKLIIGLTILSIVFTIFILLYHPKERANAYREAFCLLDNAINQYEFCFDDDQIAESAQRAELVKAVEKGEKLIRDVENIY